MSPSFYKRFVLPHLLTIIGFYALALTYHHPLLQGRELRQQDIKQFKGMVQGQRAYKEKTGEMPLWAPRMFSGMPGFQISMPKPNSMKGWKQLGMAVKNFVPRPAAVMALYFIGFYTLLLAFGLSQGLAVAGALAFGLSSYNLIIIEAGHMTKAFALGYAPMVMAGVVFTFRSRAYWLGAGLTAVTLALEIWSNHLQVTYYLLYIILFFGLGELVLYVRRKESMAFARRAGALVLAALLAISANLTHLWISYDYAKETIRGKSELTTEKQNRTSGLDKDYILNDYSYGVLETFNLMIPNLMGGASMGSLDTESETYDMLTQQGVPPNRAKQFVQRLPLYWGPQRFTSGPVYVGAVIVFLFFLGLIVYRKPLRWWLLAVTLLAIMLAWGKHFRSFSEFFIHYVPFYNKFRTVSMTLIIVQITMPLLGFLGVRELVRFRHTSEDAQEGAASKRADKRKAGLLKPQNPMEKGLLRAIAIAGGICLVFVLLPGLFLDFSGASDQQLLSQLPKGMRSGFLDSLQEDRKSMARTDALRSLFFVVAAGGVLLAFLRGKLRYRYLVIGLGALILLDMWLVDRRYLDEESYIKPSMAQQQNFPLTPADQRILQDKDPHYRVLNLTVSPFNDATTSYYHRSIGGYHGAKLRRYQELIEYGISPEIQRLRKSQGNPFGKTPVLNMLDCRYVIAGRKANQVVRNPKALGPAWFVDEIKRVPDADAEIKAVSQPSFQPRRTAVVDRRFASILPEDPLAEPSSAQIELTQYSPDTVRYRADVDSKGFAVFSEVYYNNDKGWQAYLDGKQVPHARVNYTLRGMPVPAGEHEIAFVFEPRGYLLSERVALTSSLAMFLLLAGGIWHARKRPKDEEVPASTLAQ